MIIFINKNNMGLEVRKRTGNIINGSKLNVPGQGISTSKKQKSDKLQIKHNKQKGNN